MLISYSRTSLFTNTASICRYLGRLYPTAGLVGGTILERTEVIVTYSIYEQAKTNTSPLIFFFFFFFVKKKKKKMGEVFVLACPYTGILYIGSFWTALNPKKGLCSIPVILYTGIECK